MTKLVALAILAGGLGMATAHAGSTPTVSGTQTSVMTDDGVVGTAAQSDDEKKKKKKTGAGSGSDKRGS